MHIKERRGQSKAAFPVESPLLSVLAAKCALRSSKHKRARDTKGATKTAEARIRERERWILCGADAAGYYILLSESSERRLQRQGPRPAAYTTVQ